jgi:hypothetical protein
MTRGERSRVMEGSGFCKSVRASLNHDGVIAGRVYGVKNGLTPAQPLAGAKGHEKVSYRFPRHFRLYSYPIGKTIGL